MSDRIIFIIFFILIDVVTLLPKVNINYHPVSNNLDTNIKTRSLKIIDSILIEETEDYIITYIHDVDFSPDGKKILLSDPTSGLLLIIDSNLGKILESYKADISLTDSLIFSGVKPINYLNMKEYIRREDYNSRKIGDNEKSWIKNKIFKPIYIDNNSIYVTAVIYAFASTSGSNNICDNRTAIIQLDSNLKVISCKILQYSEEVSALPLNFYVDKINDQFLVTCENPSRELFDVKYDSLASIAKFDKNGNFLSVVNYLPIDYSQNYLGYDYPCQPFLTDYNNTPIICYPIDLSLYKTNNQKIFNFFNTPYSNDTGLTIIREIRKNFVNEVTLKPLLKRSDTGESYRLKFRDYYLKKQEFSINRKLFNRLLPVQVLNIFSYGDNIIVWLNIDDPDNELNYHYILQEYNFNGDLISHTPFIAKESAEINFIHFDKANNCLVIFKKKSNGWLIEKRLWE